MDERIENNALYDPNAWYAAEESVAGCIMCEPTETLRKVREIVSAGDFAAENTRAVFTAACELADDGKPVDPVTILDRAKEDGFQISEKWAMETMRMFITTANVAYNASIIHESAIDRKARDIGESLSSGFLKPQEALEELQSTLSQSVSILSKPEVDANEFYSYVSEVAEGKIRPFLPTGLDDLDEMLGGGFISEGLITLAARPGIGKTVAALVIADNVAARGGKVLYESLEMSKEQLWARRVARESRIPYTKLLNGGFDINSQEVWSDIARATQKLSERNLVINSTNAKMSDIERHVRQAGELDLIVIDHLGLIIPDRASESLYYPTTMAIHALKRLAKSTGTPVLCLCQLNRANMQRQDKRGNLADLRNSGAIEEDSDAVVFLHREAYYLPPEEQPKYWESQTMEMNVAKNRHGQTGAIQVDFIGGTANIRSTRSPFAKTDIKTPF